MPEVKFNVNMSERKRKRGRPRLAPVLSYGAEMRMRNNVARTIKKPRYLRDEDESRSRGSTPKPVDNVSINSKSSVNGAKSRNSRGYNPDIDDKDSEYHYGSDFDVGLDEDSETERPNTGIGSRSTSDGISDLDETDLDAVSELGEGIPEGGDALPGRPPVGSEVGPDFVPFWKLGPAGNLGYRAHTPIPVWLQDREYPELELAKSSDDLLLPRPFILQAISIYEVLRHFRNLVRLSPFHFEDFCAALLAEEQSVLLGEIHICLIKTLIREEEAQQTHFGQLDQKDSINITLYFIDSMTWPETFRQYLQSDKDFQHILKILNSCNYPYTSLTNRLKVLQFLCDQFLQTSVVREDLLTEGKIRYDDHCRVCHKTGDLLCCDSCSAVYHLDCADPPLSNAPHEIEDWTCSVCNKHKLEGVTDCLSLMETAGNMCRQEPLGYDRHGRKYWFLVRRIIVESEDGDVWYYSTIEKLDLLLTLIDNIDLEEALFVALKEFGEDIRRQMEITEKLTEKTRGSKNAEITRETEETRKVIEEMRELKVKQEELVDPTDKLIEEVKDEGGVSNNSVMEQPLLGVKNEIKQEEEIKNEIKEEEMPFTGIKEELETKEEIKGEIEVLTDVDQSKSKREVKPREYKLKEVAPKIWDEATIQAMVNTKLQQLQCHSGQLFRLGSDNNYRNYINQFVVNTLALNKLQHNEERDKKRHLSHKFSLTCNSDFKWNGQSHGTRENQIQTLRQTLLSLEQNISSHFFHPHWQHVRKLWAQSLTSSATLKQFAKAMMWLVSCIKPVVFTSVWHESLGHVRLKRITALDREERKKQEKREKKESDEEARLIPFVKFTKGVKHQLWKVKGEEYRIHALYGWQWLSIHRKCTHVPMSTVGLRAGAEKVTLPIKSNTGLMRGLPISAASYSQLAAKNPSLQFSLLSPKQLKAENPDEYPSSKESVEQKKEFTVGNAGTQQKLEITSVNLEDHFEDGVVNVSKALNSRIRLVYPKLSKGSMLDSLLTRRLSLKLQEEREFASKQLLNESKKDEETEAAIDVEANDTDATLSDHSADENIEELPDSQRSTIHKQRPAGHLLKEMRTHKLKYEALDKVDEFFPCYSPSCRGKGRSSCYSPSCIFKERTKQKLINSVNNYKIITSKPAPFENVGSCSPVRLADQDNNTTAGSVNGQVASSCTSFTLEPSQKRNDSKSQGKEKTPGRAELKVSFDEDSCHSLGSTNSDHKVTSRNNRIFSTECPSGKIYLKKSILESKRTKKLQHKTPQINFFKINSKINTSEKSTTENNFRHTLFSLCPWELHLMARKGGKYAPLGFNQNAKVSPHIWPYPCARPVFKINWLYRTVTMATVSAVAHQLRIMWACLRWDDMHEKGPSDGRKQITTDIEIIQTEILKRKYSGRFYEKTEYLRRKVTIPFDVPKPVREFTPSQRSGLRKRRRAQSPVNKQPKSIEEWVEEEKLDLWEIRYFSEQLEKAALMSKKGTVDKEGNFTAVTRSTSPVEFKAKLDEQLKLQRAAFNQKKSFEVQNLSTNKGIVKVAISSALSNSIGGSKITIPSGKVISGGSSILTVGSKLPSVISGRKIVTTKGGKIITVQTSGGVPSSQGDGPSKLILGKSSVFPVSTLPKVQVTPQGNKVIRLQNISSGGQRTILPRVVTSNSTTSSTNLIRPITSNTTSFSANQVFQTTSPSIPTIRPTTSGQQIQIIRLPDGQVQVRGLQDGQQLLQRGDGKLHLVNTKPNVSPQLTSANPPTPIQVTQQTKPLPGSKEPTIRGVTPLTSGQIVKINGQQVLLRTGGSNGKQIIGVNAADVVANSSQPDNKVITTPLSGTPGASKFQTIKTPDGFTVRATGPTISNNQSVTSLLKDKQAIINDKPKLNLSPAPISPTKSNNNNTTSVTNTLTLRVQVRMTEQGPKTIIQGLQPGVGLTKDHIMAIQQQVRSMLAQYNLQVNQLSPLMTLTLHVTNKTQAQTQLENQSPETNEIQRTSTPIQQVSPIKETAVDVKEPFLPNNKLGLANDKKSLGIPDEVRDTTTTMGVPDEVRDSTTTATMAEQKEKLPKKFVLTNDYIQQSIKSALTKNDLTPDVEEKLMQLHKLTTIKNKKDVPKSSAQENVAIMVGKGSKRPRDQDENEWDEDSVTPSRSKSKRTKSDRSKSKKEVTVNSVANARSQIQDAKKKVARQQKLEGLLAKHKDLLKKDILKKRAFLEKELQIQIHKELAAAKQQIQSLEKVKVPEPTVAPSTKRKLEPATSVQSSAPPKESPIRPQAPKKGEPFTFNAGAPSSSKSAKTSCKNNKKSSKNKSKKIVCICRTTFDDSKFYVGCDLCGNWFHGDCVGITETLSRSLTEYVCDDCANAKLNKELFCLCKLPYDETQFYICCERCDDWYHGKCIGIMQSEAEDIDDYICPVCDPDNVWNRPCQKKLTSKDYMEVKKLSKMLVQHKNAWPFLEPVDQSEVPDYYKVVKVPMDLKCIEKKATQHKYTNISQFVGDVMLVFDNCRAYNPPNSSFCSCANTLEAFFGQKLKQLKLKVSQKT